MEIHIATLSVQVSNNWVLWVWVIVIAVQVLGKYMNIRYLDPLGQPLKRTALFVKDPKKSKLPVLGASTMATWRVWG